MTITDAMSHEEALELLPWLVNDSLAAGEREAVATHASACIICRRELTELEALRERVTQAAAQVSAPDIDMRRINARIDADVNRARMGKTLFATMRGLFSRPWSIVFVAQTAAIIIMAFLWLQPQNEEPQFRTLTTPQALPAGQYLRVVFDPTIEASALSQWLQSHSLQITDGPSQRGLYTLESAAGTENVDFEQLAVELLDDPRVLFAQPVTQD